MERARNTIALPLELIPLLTDSWVCEYASIRKNGTPVTHPLLPWPGEDGRTIDVNTGLAYPTKAEMARNNPHVCLLYSDPTCLRWADIIPPPSWSTVTPRSTILIFKLTLIDMFRV